MIRIITLREIKDHVLSLRFSFSFLLCLLLMVIGSVVLTEEQGQRREALEPFLDTDQYRQVVQQASSQRLMNGGLFLTRPLPKFRMLVYGLQDLSFIAQIKGANQVLYLRQPLVGNPVAQLFSNFDVVFIVGALFSLVAITFTYDAVAGENEDGTLRLVLSHSVSRAQLLLGKWLGAFVSLVAILAPCSLATVLVAASHPLVEVSSADGLTLLLIGGGCLLYVGVFLSLGLLVSCQCRETRTALLGLLAIWALLVWVVPSFGPYLAASLVDGDPPLMVEANINQTRAEAERQSLAEVSAFIQEKGWGDRESAHWNLEWGAWSDAIPRLWNELPDEADREALRTFSTRIMRDQLKQMEEQAAQLRNAYLQSRQREVKAGQVLACISPLAPFAFLLTDLSQTGLRSEFHFRGGVERFKRELVGYIYREMGNKSIWDQVDPEGFPYFVYASRTTRIGAETFIYFLLLGVYNVIFFMGAYLVFLRYEV
jgi:ABC-type transport system involved in multi-copper enzyme maturation permease subunit